MIADIINVEGSTLEELNLFFGMLLESDYAAFEATSIGISLKIDHSSSLSRNIPAFFVSRPRFLQSSGMLTMEVSCTQEIAREVFAKFLISTRLFKFSLDYDCGCKSHLR